MRAAPSGIAVCLSLLAACATGQHPFSAAPGLSPSQSASSGTSPFRPEARALFAGCVGRTSGHGRTYACADVEAWILDMGAVEPEVAMRIGASGLRSMSRGAGEGQKTELLLAGRRWPAIRIWISNALE